MNVWRRVRFFLSVVACIAATVSGTSVALASPTTYAYDGVSNTSTAALAGVISAPATDSPGQPRRLPSGRDLRAQPIGFVAAETASDYVNVASPGRTEHILNGDATGGGHMWPGAAGKSPFPEDWSGAKIMHEASDIATDPGATLVSRGGGREVFSGTRGGVDIRVVVDYNNNDIITAYPTNLPRNP